MSESASATVPAPTPAPTSTAPKLDEFRAGLFMIAGAATLATHFAIIKYLTADMPPPVLALWRGVFAALLFMPRVAYSGWGLIATSRPIGHAWRSFFGFLSFLLFIYTLGLLPLGDAVAISFTSPFWSVILGFVVFRDRMSWRLAAAVAIAFAGVPLIAQPSAPGVGIWGSLGWGAVLGLASAVLTSLAMMMIKQLSKSEPPDRIAFYFMIGGAVYALPVASFDWVLPHGIQWLWLVVCAAMFYVGQTCLSRAYAYGTFSRVAPLDLVRLPVSLIIGFLWFGEVPSLLGFAGMALIALATLDLLLQGRKTR
ncbi:MAG: DMT family transporter [Alphaproteobacteria bacterium]|nr:DMT family transporter [Alphaproteobacteria bacterium]